MNGYENLCAAVLQQAAKDYQTALMKKDANKAAYLEDWFLSDWGQLLSRDAGELIIQECRKRVATKARPNRLANKVKWRWGAEK